MHPIFSAALRRPDLLADHASNYIALAREEVSQTVRGLVVRAVGGVVVAIALPLALGFSGVAFMLGALNGFARILLIVPGLTFVIAAIGGYLATRPGVAEGVLEMKVQFDADMAAMRLAGGSNK
ncbi:hypothetical protein ACSFA3_20850 [Variovorax sp. RHLX14]|uniref:hypothetical protein n=1 Tax=Variovorax sp. RHLX14 TaxID=1259731 RepID=UPI003F4821FD